MKRYLPILLLMLSACSGSDPDNTPPKISINGNNPLNVSYSTPFVDPGATATDDVDGVVNVEVSSTVLSGELGTYTIIYSASDTSGNVISVERIVNIIDDIPPVLTVINSEDLALEVNDTLFDFGASAEDEIDGEIEVEVESNVDLTTPGDYTVVYSAEDTSNNRSEFVRNVKVTPKQVVVTVSIFGEGTTTSLQGFDLTCDEGMMCEVTVDEGTEITFVAEPIAPSSFNYWSNCDSTNDTSCTVSVDADRLLHLSFKQDTPLELADNVIIFTEEQIKSIVDYDELTGLITLASGTNIQELEVGKIIVSTGIYNGVNDPENVEFYFARRIERISVLGQSNVLIDTAEVSLDEFILQGDLSYSSSIGLNSLDPTSLPDGISINYGRIDQLKQSAQTNSFDVIPFKIDIAVNENLSITGEIDVNIDPDINMSFSVTSGLKELKLSSDIELSSALGLSINGTIEDEISRPIGNPIRFSPIITGPVVIVPELQFSVVVKASASGSYNPTISLSANMSGGAHYLKTAGWRAIKSFDLGASANLNILEQTEIELDLKAGPALGLEFLLYGLVGPKVSANGHGGISASPIIPMSDGCEFDVSTYLGFGSKYGGSLKLFTKLYKYEANLFNTKYVLSSTTEECVIERPLPPEPIEITNIDTTSLSVNWTPTEQDKNVTYSLFQGFDLIGSNLTGSSFDVTNLQPETEYCYFVVAITNNNEKLQSEPTDAACSFTLSDESPVLNVPMSVTTEAQSTSSILIDWTEVRESTSLDYVIYQFVDGIPFALERTNVTNGVALGLQPDTEYCFAVSTIDEAGNESSLSAQSCTSTFPPDLASWTIFLACQGREYLIEEQLDLDEEYASVVSVVGDANDYDGTPLIYSLSGLYNVESSELDGSIVWTFEDNSRRRVDEFLVNLSSGDTGDVNMNQVEVTGCDAMIRFVKDSESIEPISPKLINRKSNAQLLEIGLN